MITMPVGLTTPPFRVLRQTIVL